MIGVGIIGYGYWGPNLARNFSEIPEAHVVAVSDLREERLALAKNRYPAIKAVKDYHEIITHPSVDAIAIATPVSTHFELAFQSLRAGKHVLIEKPMTAKSQESEILVEEAIKRKLVLMVDHTFVYMGAVRKIKDIIQSGDSGDIYYYDSTRVNLGLFQHDVNVVWDLAVHDLSILDFLISEHPVAVTATGARHINNAPENVAYITLFFQSPLIAHFNVNWLSPVKVRMTLIGGNKKMIVWDDLQPTEKIKVYDSGIIVNNKSDSDYEILIDYRTGDMWAPKFDMTEALRVEALHFIDCIERGHTPITNGETGLRVVRILEAATKSIQEQGKLIKLR